MFPQIFDIFVLFRQCLVNVVHFIEFIKLHWLTSVDPFIPHLTYLRLNKRRISLIFVKVRSADLSREHLHARHFTLTGRIEKTQVRRVFHVLADETFAFFLLSCEQIDISLHVLP